MIEELTPKQIVLELDKYIIGQQAAKRAVAIALRNRFRRRLLPEDLRAEVIPKNILMIGPTGVGKTEIARRLANLAHAPFVKVEATKFTEVGYVGRDVDSMIRDLVQESVRMVEKEMTEQVKDKAAARAVNRIVDIMHPEPKGPVKQMAAQVNTQVESIFNSLFRGGNVPSAGGASPFPTGQVGASNEPPPAADPDSEETDDNSENKSEQSERIRQKLREQVASGARDDETIELETEETASVPMLQVFGGPTGPGEDMGMDMQSMLGSLLPKRKKKRTMTIREARDLLQQDEAKSLIDHDQLARIAVDRAEQTGIIFVDEMDKIAGRSEGARGPDVSREGVQRDILPIIEGSTIQTKYGAVRTDFVLFIAAGAFHVSKPSDLIPELQGRLPIRVELESLTQDDFRRILTEPKNALVNQYTALLSTEGVTITFDREAVNEVAKVAAEVNSRMENIGARRLHTIMERLLDDISFDAPNVEQKEIVIDADYVHSRLDSVVKDEDLSHYIL